MDGQKELFDWTPLHMACWKGHTKVVQKLLELGVDQDKLVSAPATMVDEGCDEVRK